MKSIKALKKWIDEAFKVETDAESLVLKMIIQEPDIGNVTISYEVPLLNCDQTKVKRFLSGLEFLQEHSEVYRVAISSAVVTMGNSTCDLGVGNGG
jgi:hypothetical protein